MSTEIQAGWSHRPIFVKLCQAGYSVETAGDITRKLLRAQLSSVQPGHLFFDFERSLRIISKMEGLGPSAALDYAARNVEAFYEVLDLPYRPGASLPVVSDSNLAHQMPLSRNNPYLTNTPPEKSKSRSKGREPLPFNLAEALETLKASYKAGVKIKSAEKIAHGPFKDQMTWGSLGGRLKTYAKHNPDCGFDSIAGFAKKHGLKKPSRKKESAIKTTRSKSAFDQKGILESIQETINATGTPPSLKSGQVEYGPYAGKISWTALSQRINTYARKNPDCGFKSLPSFMKANGLKQDKTKPEKLKKEKKVKDSSVDLQLALETISETMSQTGRRPKKNDGEIGYGPYAGKMTWASLNGRLMVYGKANTESGFSGLVSFMDKNNIANPKKEKPARQKKVKDSSVDLQLALETISETILQTGRRPKKNDGEIGHGPYAGKMTWARLNGRLMVYGKANAESGFSGLVSFMDKNNIANPKKEKSKKEKPEKKKRNSGLNIPDTIETIAKTIESTGKRPTIQSGMITDGPLANKCKWASLNATISKYSKSNPDCGFNSLGTFMDHHKLGEKTKRGMTPLTATRIFNTAAAALKETGVVPSLIDPTAKIGDLAIGRINSAFKRSALPDIDNFTLPNQPSPASLQEFLLVSGLVEVNDQQLVVADRSSGQVSIEDHSEEAASPQTLVPAFN